MGRPAAYQTNGTPERYSETVCLFLSELEALYHAWISSGDFGIRLGNVPEILRCSI